MAADALPPAAINTPAMTKESDFVRAVLMEVLELREDSL